MAKLTYGSYNNDLRKIDYFLLSTMFASAARPMYLRLAALLKVVTPEVVTSPEVVTAFEKEMEIDQPEHLTLQPLEVSLTQSELVPLDSNVEPPSVPLELAPPSSCPSAARLYINPQLIRPELALLDSSNTTELYINPQLIRPELALLDSNVEFRSAPLELASGSCPSAASLDLAHESQDPPDNG